MQTSLKTPARSPGPHWLSLERIRLYAAAFLLAQLVSLPLGMAIHSTNEKLAQYGSPWANDFRVFWSAARLALEGSPAAAYDMSRLLPIMQSATPEMTSAPGWAHWFYPPTFLMVMAPFGLLGFWLAYTVFVSVTATPYLHLLLRICRPYKPWLLLLAFPPTLTNAFHGQNAFLTAALAAGALCLLPARPLLAGACIGLLSFKPHLALLFPVALLAIGAWRTIAMAAITAMTFAGTSYVLFGSATFAAFFDNIHLAQHFNASGQMPYFKMPTVFSAMRMVDLAPWLANAAQLAVASVAAIAVAIVWRKSPEPRLRNAVLMTASLLVSPYMYEYDMTWLAFPIAWFAMHGLQSGWRRGERTILLLAWLLPFACVVLAQATDFQLGPVVLLGLLLTLVRRALAAPAIAAVDAGIRAEASLV